MVLLYIIYACGAQYAVDPMGSMEYMEAFNKKQHLEHIFRLNIFNELKLKFGSRYVQLCLTYNFGDNALPPSKKYLMNNLHFAKG